MNEYQAEQVKFAMKDSELLSEISSWLEAYSFEIEAKGRSGEIELKKVKELVPMALKALVNYL